MGSGIKMFYAAYTFLLLVFLNSKAIDLCINRQPRPAYRCNMSAKRKYCFKLGNLCYVGHNPINGQMHMVNRMGLVECVDDHTWQRQNTVDDFNETNRRTN